MAEETPRQKSPKPSKAKKAAVPRVPKKLAESADNLRKRAEWFRKRTGADH